MQSARVQTKFNQLNAVGLFRRLYWPRAIGDGCWFDGRNDEIEGTANDLVAWGIQAKVERRRKGVSRDERQCEISKIEVRKSEFEVRE